MTTENENKVACQLVDIRKTHSIFEFLDYRAWLEAIFFEMKKQLKTYSYLKFSKELKLGSSNVHLVISGKRLLTAKTGDKIAKSLALDTAEKKYLDLLVEYGASTAEQRAALFKKLIDVRMKRLASATEREELEFFTEWYHLAIIELLRIPESSDDAEWLAQKLSPRVPLHTGPRCGRL